MSVGKYSPTVSAAYHKDQDWWKRNGGENPANISIKKGEHALYFYDRDGYDSYGYNVAGIDRAGHTECEYLTTAEWLNEGGSDVYVYLLYETISFEWSVTDEQGLPKKIRDNA